MRASQLHENIYRKSHGEEPSERSLGFALSIIILILGTTRLYLGLGWGMFLVLISAIFLLLTLFWAAPLRPLNKIWFRFGLLLFRITNPFLMGIVFFITIFPIGIIIRILGKDPLRLKFNKEIRSYWLERAPPEDSTNNMRNQF